MIEDIEDRPRPFPPVPLGMVPSCEGIAACLTSIPPSRGGIAVPLSSESVSTSTGAGLFALPTPPLSSEGGRFLVLPADSLSSAGTLLLALAAPPLSSAGWGLLTLLVTPLSSAVRGLLALLTTPLSSAERGILALPATPFSSPEGGLLALARFLSSIGRGLPMPARPLWCATLRGVTLALDMPGFTLALDIPRSAIGSFNCTLPTFLIMFLPGVLILARNPFSAESSFLVGRIRLCLLDSIRCSASFGSIAKLLVICVSIPSSK
mmetsp:Transcript_29621/g.58694  ORF Transcript_29621/g.58694 Transcript_29621/m.58694 type:complete len:265 (-) Transcript_29621:1760-2554(-)